MSRRPLLTITCLGLFFMMAFADSNPHSAPTANALGATTAPTASTVDPAADTSLADIVNQYRVDHGAKALKLPSTIAFFAASRAYLALAGIDLGQYGIDSRLLNNYSVNEYAAWGNLTKTVTCDATQAFKSLKVSDGLLDSKAQDLGAVFICSQGRYAVVVILGHAL